MAPIEQLSLKKRAPTGYTAAAACEGNTSKEDLPLPRGDLPAEVLAIMLAEAIRWIRGWWAKLLLPRRQAGCGGGHPNQSAAVGRVGGVVG